MTGDRKTPESLINAFKDDGLQTPTKKPKLMGFKRVTTSAVEV
jgi:hypothetical protein